MNEPKSRPAVRPTDIRSISDPPDMGRLRPAWKVAEEQLRHGRLGQVVEVGALGEAEKLVGDIIRQSRVEGAAAALESLNDIAKFCEDRAGEHESKAADTWVHESSSERAAGTAEAFGLVAALLRARIKTISDPPDMG